MINKIGILKLENCGNILSLKNSFEYCGASIKFIENRNDFKNIDKILIPGVGSFSEFKKNLNNKDIFEDLLANVEKKPTLGICIGMQVLGKKSEENGINEGLNIFNCNIVKIKTSKKLPIIGYNNINVLKKSDLTKNINEKDLFYFMHSYAVETSKNDIANVKYYDTSYTSIIAKGHIFGVQFHIEKSKESGLKIIQNFLKL